MDFSKHLSSISAKTVLPLVCLSSVFLASCKEKDKVNKLSDDPRVRRVVFDEFPNYDFIVNDYEGVIYNYDSLPYGTKADSLSPFIYGYASTDLMVGIKKEGTDALTLYTTATKLDLTKPLTIVSTSEDMEHSKSYTFDLRIHKYDIDAFDWEEISTLDLTADTILSEKSVKWGSQMLWFVKTEQGQYVFKSAEGKVWEKQTIESSLDIDFFSILLNGDSLYAITNEKKIVAASTDFSFTSTTLGEISEAQRLLFSIDGKLWLVSNDSLYSYSKSRISPHNASKEFISKALSENFKTFTASSGYTTLGYCYSAAGTTSEIWSLDRYGNTVCLAKNALPYRSSPVIFNYGETLGFIGGYSADNELSDKCYCSYNSGLHWKGDWHKDLTENIGGLAQAGIFITSDKGEMLLVGGITSKGLFPKVMSGRLRKIKQQEEFLNSVR